MPIFEYICRDCSHRFEWLVRRASVPHCPECDSEVLERQLSVFAVSTGAANTRVGEALRDVRRPAGTGCLFAQLSAWDPLFGELEARG